MDSIVILGAGFSAAFCYKAIEDWSNKNGKNFKVSVYSDAYPPSPFGAFWIHWIPEYLKRTVKGKEIGISYIGSRDLYVGKQWGTINYSDNSDSFPEYGHTEIGYNPAEVREFLLPKNRVTYRSRFSEEEIYDLASDSSLLFYTFPLESSMESRKKFLTKFPILLRPYPEYYKNYTIYDGTSSRLVRSSVLFGQYSMEFVLNTPMDSRILNDKTVKIGQFPDMHPDTPELDEKERLSLSSNAYPLGRFAKFKRHELSHDAYAETAKILEAYYE